MKKPKFIADQFEFALERPFVVFDRVVVSPIKDDPFLSNKTIYAQVVQVITRNEINEVIAPFLIVQDEINGERYPVYPSQCRLRI
jgi:hypothetical protein